jgi:hypothetical protein
MNKRNFIVKNVINAILFQDGCIITVIYAIVAILHVFLSLQTTNFVNFVKSAILKKAFIALNAINAFKGKLKIFFTVKSALNVMKRSKKLIDIVINVKHAILKLLINIFIVKSVNNV